MNRILFLPSVKQGKGTGHLHRCARWARALGRTSASDDSPQNKTALFIPHDGGNLDPSIIAGKYGSNSGEEDSACLDKPFLLVDSINQHDWNLAIYDRFRTTVSDLIRLTGDIPTLAVDEGGGSRSTASYLIDTLPSLSTEKPNMANIGLLDLPERSRDFSTRWRSVIVTFGGEDPAGLGTPVVKSLINAGVDHSSITVVTGAFARNRSFPEGVVVQGSIPNLMNELPAYDLVITSFGLTAYEAIASGICTILVNPSNYHNRLSNKAGFPVAGRPSLNHRLKMMIEQPERIAAMCRQVDLGEPMKFEDAVSSLTFSADSGCPSCRSRRRTSVCRRHERTFFICRDCGICYQVRFLPDPTTYSKEYFFEDYSRQYGKTYLEDFNHIRDMGRDRMARIDRLCEKRAGRSLLDVGCAYGPFLAAAAEYGWKPFGMDISEDAAGYVRESLGIPAESGDFLDFDSEKAFSIRTFDAVSMWYVIEHFQNIAAILKKVSALITKGGILCFSTPNLCGISGRRDRQKFLAEGPADHYTIWSPRSARSVLKRFGFKVVLSRNTGHHPERFPTPLRIFLPFYSLLSRIFRLGDTFEIYALYTGRKDG